MGSAATAFVFFGSFLGESGGTSTSASWGRSSGVSRFALNFGLDLVGEGCECLFDIDGIFGWSFQEFDAQRVSKGLSFFGLHLSASF